MRIQPIPQPTMTSRYKLEKFNCIDGYVAKKESITLNNGNKLTVMTEYKDGEKVTSLQYLTDNVDKWIKSKLRYFKGGKVFKTLLGERQG